MSKRDNQIPKRDQPAGGSDAADLFAGCGGASCPSLRDLESDAATGARASLASGCARCVERLEAVRANQVLLGELFSDAGGRVPDGDGGAVVDVPPALAGYTILEPISSGGQATVYRAVHDASKRVVAIKVMHGVATDRLASARLERELQILARFRHPGIVTVHDGGWTSDGLPYIVMEFIEGGTLKERAQAARFHASRAGVRFAVELVRDIASAVAAAQRTGLIHRDLKPGNILIDEHGHPKVADFGVARERGSERDGGDDPAQGFVGSIAYAAPEQFAGGGVSDARVDVYSLGLVLRELVVGHRLRRDPLRSDAVPSAREENPLVPGDVDRLIARATAIDPAERYASAGELADDLDRWLSGYPIRERQSQRGHVLARFVGRHPIGMAVAAVFLGTLLVYAIGMTRSAALIRAQNLVLEKRLQEREAVMSAMSEPLAAIDADASLESVRDINELLLRAADAIQTHLDDEPALQSRLLTRVGQALLYRREHEHAERFLGRAHELELALADGQPTARLGETLHDLGRLAWHRASADRANAGSHLRRSVAHYEGAYAIREEVLPAGSQELALTMSHLGSAYSSLGRFDEADAIFAEVLALREASAEGEPLELVRTLMSIGSHRYRKNDLEGSEGAFARAEAAARAAGVGLPLASAINARGLLLLELDRAGEARAKFDESAELRRSLLGPFDADYLASRRDLALAMLEAGDIAHAHAVATSVLQSLPMAGNRALGSERIARFVTLAAEARLSVSARVPDGLRALWDELAPLPRVDGATDRRMERLRASTGLELAEAMLEAFGAGVILPDDAAAARETLGKVLQETRLDLELLVPSPRRQRDTERLGMLRERADRVFAGDRM